MYTSKKSKFILHAHHLKTENEVYKNYSNFPHAPYFTILHVILCIHTYKYNKFIQLCRYASCYVS